MTDERGLIKKKKKGKKGEVGASSPFLMVRVHAFFLQKSGDDFTDEMSDR